MQPEEIFLLIQFIQIKMEICLILIMARKILKNGNVNFIGDAESRVKEDYLRILRYVRFFINYSNQSHDPKIIKIIKKNIGGVSKLSSERLLDEFKKLTKSSAFLKIFKDETCLELIKIIFPQLNKLRQFYKIKFSC